MGDSTYKQTIAMLERDRIEKGFKPGWTFFQCKQRGLEGLYSSMLKSNELSKMTRALLPRKLRRTVKIELVPSTCWYSNVRSNVTEQEWKHIKPLTTKNAGHRCEICLGVGPQWPVECHEVWKYDDKTLRQTLTGFIALCPMCHRVKHYGLAQIQGHAEEAIAHMMEVNDWTRDRVNLHINERKSEWKERSKYEWTLDIRLLRDYRIDAPSPRKMKAEPT